MEELIYQLVDAYDKSLNFRIFSEKVKQSEGYKKWKDKVIDKSFADAGKKRDVPYYSEQTAKK